MKLFLILITFVLSGSIHVKADAFCANDRGQSSYHRTAICPDNLKEIKKSTFWRK